MKKLLIIIFFIIIGSAVISLFVSKEHKIQKLYDFNKRTDSCAIFDKGKLIGRSAVIIYLSEKTNTEYPLRIDIMKVLKIEDSISTCKKCNKPNDNQ